MARANTADIENAAEEAKNNAAEIANEALKKTAETAGKIAAQTEEAIVTHPYKSVLIALGVGTLLGVLLSRRS